MSDRIWAALAVLVVAGCSSSRRPAGHIVVAVTMDWEGADLDPDALDALATFRAALGNAPMTFFISAAYFTKASPDPSALDTIKGAVGSGDELAVHLHAWQSLAKASGVEPKLGPSFLTGSDDQPFPDGDIGFETDLDAYDVASLRAMVRTSRQLFAPTQLPVSTTFRAGGYLGTPKVLEAIHDEGFTVDSSATDARAIDVDGGEFLSKRLSTVWPTVTMTSQPFVVHAHGGDMLELPLAAIADYTTPEKIAHVFAAAHAQLQNAPNRDVFVVLAFHLETATDFAPMLAGVLMMERARPDVGRELTYVTMQKSAQLARAALASKP